MAVTPIASIPKTLRRFVRACAALALLAAGPARADDPAPSPGPRLEWVIPMGQEPVVIQMLGGTGTLAGCRYENIHMSGDRVDASFRCEGRATLLEVRLAHRASMFCSGTCTEKFVVTVPADAPAGFAEALRTSVASHEARFVFRRPDERRRSGAALDWWLENGPTLGIGGLLLLVVVRALLRRRRERRAATATTDEGNPSAS